MDINQFLEQVKAKDPDQPEFLQAVEEVVTTLILFIEKESVYQKEKILERMVEPEQIVMFRVP